MLWNSESSRKTLSCWIQTVWKSNSYLLWIMTSYFISRHLDFILKLEEQCISQGDFLTGIGNNKYIVTFHNTFIRAFNGKISTFVFFVCVHFWLPSLDVLARVPEIVFLLFIFFFCTIKVLPKNQQDIPSAKGFLLLSNAGYLVDRTLDF